MPRNYNVVGYETLTIAATAVLLTGTGRKQSFVGVLETAQIRYRGDGTAPTSSEGRIMEVGDQIVMSESEVDATRFIRTGGTSGVLKGEFYDANPADLL